MKHRLIEAQLIESALLNIVNYQTLIATKASRIKQVAKDEMVMEFGTSRAHEMDAAVWGARATIIGGVEATSNVRAGKSLVFLLREHMPIHSYKHIKVNMKHFIHMQSVIKMCISCRYVQYVKNRSSDSDSSSERTWR